MSKIWSSDSDFIVYVVMWPKFGKKNQKVLGVNSYFSRAKRGKRGGGGGGGGKKLSIQNRVNLKLKAQKYIYICTTWKFKAVNLLRSDITVCISFWFRTLNKIFIDSRIITWLNCRHCLPQTIWIMFAQAAPTKSGTLRSSNSHILTVD